MKTFKKVLASALAAAMVVTAFPVTNAEAATKAKLSTKKATIYVGQSKTIKVTLPKGAKITSVKTSKKAVATVKKSGKKVVVKAVKAGKATVTVKVTPKKGKATNLKATITVKNEAIRVSGDSVVTVGATTTLKTATAPKNATVTFKSSDDTIATVDEKGVVTGVKAGKVTITATAGKASKDIEIEVKAAGLKSVTQTASNAFTAEFTGDASKNYTKDDITVAAADGSTVLAVKSVEFAADGKTAKVTVFGNFTNGTAYKVTCKDSVVDLTAKVGEVSRIAINTASAEQNVETAIDFTLFDADGIDVTPSVSLDTTCYVSVTGNYSAANLDKASKATITMNTVKDEAEVTVTYNSNAAGAQDVTATQKITCVDAKATQGTKLFAATNNTNSKSNCAKFYLGLSDASVSVSEGGNVSNVYFCAKDAKGNVISYDTYEVESSNDDVASASTTVDSGKYAVITVTGNTAGSAQVNIKATKNGKDTYYTIPVAVTKTAEAASMTVSVTRPTMSDVNDTDYFGEVKAQLYDKNGNNVSGSYSYELVTTVSGTAINVNTATGKYTAANAVAKTYTIKVTGADQNTGKTFVRNVNVTVKALPANKNNLKLTYQIELSRNTVDENPADTTDDDVTSRLYATYNGLFAGYVRTDGLIANGSVTPANAVTKVEVLAKFGTSTFAPSTDLYAAGVAEAIGNSGETFSAVKPGDITWATEGTADLAKVGTYTIEYRIYDQTDAAKYTSRTQTVTVKNSVVVPTVAVTSRTVDSLDYAGVQKALKTNVDMNNNTSDYESITSIASKIDGTAPVANNNKMTVKYATVVDNYGTTKWTFYVPINTTFKTE